MKVSESFKKIISYNPTKQTFQMSALNLCEKIGFRFSYSALISFILSLEQFVYCVAECKDYIIGSCKYRNEKIGVDELDLMQDYASVFGKGNNYHYYIFSKGGFTDGLLQAQERGEVQLITLEDLYR